MKPTVRRALATILENQPIVTAAGRRTTATAKDTFVTPDGVIRLSARELALCSDRGIDPAKYAEVRAAIRARSRGGK
jgi:hypothetical protein